jgi:hypothetical protein
MYPVAIVLMAIRGWWVGDMEAAFAAPITALVYTLVNYPIVVVVLWVVTRVWSTHPAAIRAVAAIAVASTVFFTVVWPLKLFRLPVAFMSVVVVVTGLAWGLAYLLAERRNA